MIENKLDKKLEKLPESLRKEALDYIDYLISKSRDASKSQNGFSFNWEGGLSELKDRFTSVELQHEANKWR